MQLFTLMYSEETVWSRGEMCTFCNRSRCFIQHWWIERLKSKKKQSDAEQKLISAKVSQMQFTLSSFCARYYSLTSKRHCRAPLQMQAECCARAWRLQADFEANSIVCSALLWCIIRLEHRHLVLWLKCPIKMRLSVDRFLRHWL